MSQVNLNVITSTILDFPLALTLATWVKLKFRECYVEDGLGRNLTYQNILVSKDGNVGVVQLNRPKVLNALNSELMVELVSALEELDKDHSVHSIILTGGENVFAAGADLREMVEATPVDLVLGRRFELWDRIRKISKPIIAAVSGYCLGGGNELAMNCDIIIASETATFGQPEVNVGIMPGAGGTQRLTACRWEVQSYGNDTNRQTDFCRRSMSGGPR